MSKILVVGDSCLDIFVYGHVDRLAPSAPVPVFKAGKAINTGGMATNVQKNILALGVDCDICTNSNWQQIIKSRYVEDRSNHMFLRVDINDNEVPRISPDALPDLSAYTAIIISDYCKGFLLEEDITNITSQHPLVFLDTKKRLGPWVSSARYIKINGYEYAKTKDSIDEDIQKNTT